MSGKVLFLCVCLCMAANAFYVPPAGKAGAPSFYPLFYYYNAQGRPVFVNSYPGMPTAPQIPTPPAPPPVYQTPSQPLPQQPAARPPPPTAPARPPPPVIPPPPPPRPGGHWEWEQANQQTGPGQPEPPPVVAPPRQQIPPAAGPPPPPQVVIDYREPPPNKCGTTKDFMCYCNLQCDIECRRQWEC